MTSTPAPEERMMEALKDRLCARWHELRGDGHGTFETAFQLICEDRATRPSSDLAEALRAFANVASEWDGEPDNLEVELKAYDSGGPGILVEAFRRARAALSAHAVAPAPREVDWSTFEGPRINWPNWKPDLQELIYTALNHLDHEGDADENAGEQIIERLLLAIRVAFSPIPPERVREKE